MALDRKPQVGIIGQKPTDILESLERFTFDLRRARIEKDAMGNNLAGLVELLT